MAERAGQRLPIVELAERFHEAMDRGRVVVTAPTGSGKSTVVPRWLVAGGHRVLVVEPRRVACRSLARWVSRQEGSPLGERVGYAVRHDDRTGPQTVLTYATTGVVLRRYQEGGGFGPFDAVVVDEAHERSVEVDLVLALLAAAPVPIKVVMSATLAAARVAAWLDAEILEGHGRVHPVAVLHRGDNVLPDGRGLGERIRAAVSEALDWPGDVLVFLPGKGEIAACEGALRGLQDVEVVPLHGALPPEAQDRAFDPGDRRRILLATNVAETSVTLPRIGVVIDAGLVRQTRYRDGHGVLTTVPIAMDAAEQRRGRAGRLMPGRCVRLWHPSARLAETTPPEILREGLERTVLTAAACGFPLRRLRLLDPPPEYALESAEARLRALGALDGEGALTDVGRAIARLPVDPVHGRMLVEAARQGRALADAVDLVAALDGGRRLLLRPQDRAEEAEDAHRRLRGDIACDATLLVAAIRRGDPGADFLNAAALDEARRVADQLRRLMAVAKPPNDARIDREGLARVVVAAVPDSAHVPRRRGDAWTCGGAELHLARESVVDPRAPAIVVVATHRTEARRGRGTDVLATVAIPTTPSVLRAAGAGTESPLESVVKGGVLRTTFARRVAQVVIDEREVVPEGEVARSEAARLFAGGRLGVPFRAVAQETGDRLAAWALLRRLRPGADLPALPEDVAGWARGRLEDLGFASGRDVALLVPDDLRVPDLPSEDRAWLDKRFPRGFDLGDVRGRVEYDVARRVVLLVVTDGRRAAPPPLTYLPAWTGWTVKWQDRNVVKVLRSGS